MTSRDWSSATGTRHALLLDTVKARRVVAHHHAGFILRNVDKILSDALDRKWKRTLRMGIVGTPHEPIHTEQMARQDSRAIIFEGRPELTLKVEAGRLLKLWFHPVMMIFPKMVHEAELCGDPSDSTFDDHKPQLRIALRHRRRYQERQTALHHEHLVVADSRMKRNVTIYC